MKSDDLKAFKISDQVKPTVDKPKGPSSKEGPPAPAASAGFPRIEALVEAAAPDLSGLEAREAELLEKAKAKGSNKDKAAAKRAATAYAKARALIAYLLETKQKMVGGGGGPSPG